MGVIIKMSLDLEYRPKDFEDVLGNEVEIKSLIKNLDKDPKKADHCYVIIGPSGCGKTTLARIAANHLGASEIDITELNTGSNRGIETSRQIIDQMRYSMGKIKVFIIDEAHGLTPDAKRAFLKPTEEPPEHVYFFFLTTDPIKLFKGDEGKALKTRFTRVKVTQLSSKLLYRHIKRISKKEEIEVTNDVLNYISENSEGSPRTALKLLGMIGDLEDEDAQMEKLENTVISNDPEVFEFCGHLFKKNPDWNKLAEYLLAFKAKKDPEEIRRIVLGYAQSMLFKNHRSTEKSRGCSVPTAAYILECFCDYEYMNGMPGITLATYQATHIND